MNNKAKILSF